MGKAITLKNTKQEIFEAYEEAKRGLSSKKETIVNPAEEAKKKADVEAVKVAEEAVSEGVFSDELTVKYEKLIRAIEVQQAELEELYGISAEAGSLAEIINAKKEKTAQLDAEFAEKKAAIEKEIDMLQQELKDAKAKMEKDEREYAAELKQKRTREEEEYKYATKRMRQKEDDAWEDEKSERETALKSLEDLVEQKMQEVLDREIELEELREKVSEIPTLLENAKADGALAKEKELGKEYGYKKAMAEKQHEHDKAMYEKELETLRAQNGELKSQNADLQAKVAEAYAQMRELAADTVKSSGGVKILDRENGK